ncbi:hypothetical protein GCM10009760_35750 [Kitasatospora kazusensis]|uniref:non-specific serine/threonine protein kinase n=1 Tax=Kitasatospora kazusensis TaxID=407974 RepID=A0ABN2ZRC1_9ACTN
MNTGGPAARLIDGRFELLEPLGGGGMGLVWRARDTALEREVALKEVRPPDPALADADPRAAHVLRERVLREARSLARLNHPNVVTIHHIVDRPEYPHPWLVMELVTGGSLYDRLARSPLSPAEAARLGRGVLSALAAAHAAGIQHRDVKPGNVLLRPDGTPVLTDFGIAALSESAGLTTTGSLIGSPEYIAPERIRGEEGNPASDLWSLGMMLYTAVEGRHPLRRATNLATLAAVLDEPVPPAVRSGPLAPVLSAVLVRDPAARPGAALLDQLLAEAEAEACAAAAPADAVRPAEPAPRRAVPQDAVRPAVPAAPADRPPLLDKRPAPHFGPHFGPGDPAEPVRPARSRAGRNALRSGYAAAAVLAAVVLWSTGHGFGQGATSRTSAPSSPGASPEGSRTTATGAPAAAPPSTDPPSANPPSASTPAAGTDLLTPAGVRGLVQALQPLMGGTEVTELVVYPEYADANAPTAADPQLFDRFEYRDGQATRSPVGGGTVTSGDKTVDLRSVAWDALPGLLHKADQELGVTHPTTHYVIVRHSWADENATLLVYVADSYGGGYLAADLNGRVLKTFPRNG